MWIPHTIPKITFHLFTPSSSSPDQMKRGIRSEDFSWPQRTPRPLSLLCLDKISKDFTQYPRELLEWIAPINRVYLVEILNTSLPIPSVIHVPDGEYWRRRVFDTWPDFVRIPRYMETESLKIFYLTQYVTELIENSEPGYVDEEELSELLDSCSPYVTALHCKYLRISSSPFVNEQDESDGIKRDPMHVDLGFVLCHLRNLRSVRLVYGYNKISINRVYEPDIHKFNIDDMDKLGPGLLLSTNLTILAITRSDLNAKKFNRLLPYLTECHSLEEIDLSICNLQTSGGQSVARYVKTAKRLRIVNLCDNNIGSDAIMSLAFVAVWRRKNVYPAIELNLNHNNISDMGAAYLASALASRVEPFTKLKLRNCNIAEIGGINLVQSLEYDQGLRALEMDGNPLTMEVSILLHAIMKTNFNIEYLSVHNCNFPKKMVKYLRTVAFYNRYSKRNELDYIDVEYLDGTYEEQIYEGEIEGEIEIEEDVQYQ